MPSLLDRAAANAAKEEEESEAEPTQAVTIRHDATQPPVLSPSTGEAARLVPSVPIGDAAPPVPSVPLGDAQEKDVAMNGDDANKEKPTHDDAHDDNASEQGVPENVHHSTPVEAPDAEEVPTMAVGGQPQEEVEETKANETTDATEKADFTQAVEPVADEKAGDDPTIDKVLPKNSKSPKKDKKSKEKKDKDGGLDKEMRSDKGAARAAPAAGKQKKKKEVPASQDLSSMFAKKQRTSWFWSEMWIIAIDPVLIWGWGHTRQNGLAHNFTWAWRTFLI